MTDKFEFTLNNTLTEEQWDMITDVDFDRTERITFHTKHGKEVEFVKVRHGHWIQATEDFRNQVFWWNCSECGFSVSSKYNYCPGCGARMDGTQKKPCDDCQQFDCYGCEYAEREEE